MEKVNIKLFSQVYAENIKLDELFIRKYDHSLLVKKNKIELLVEIGELANETRCFKYWSDKKPNQELIGLELADCFIMTLCFFNLLNIKMDEEFSYELLDDDILDLFIKIYHDALEFVETNNRDILKKLFISLLSLGKNLGFSLDEIIEICLKKIQIDMERLR